MERRSSVSPPPSRSNYLSLIWEPRRDDTRMEEALAVARREFEQPFDLAVGPLFRAQALCLAAEDHLLVLTIHHSIFDGWSKNVFYRELAALYTAFSTGQPSPLADLAVQYADYAIWQRAHLQGNTLVSSIDYWQSQLAGRHSCSSFPRIDHVRCSEHSTVRGISSTCQGCL